MKLIIVITGLILLVPDKDNGQLHLLFPTTDLGMPGMEHHFPEIGYDTNAGKRYELLDGWRLDLRNLAPVGNASLLPPEVFRTDDFFARGVPRPWTSGFPPRGVNGQVTLPWPNTMKAGDPGYWIYVAEGRASYITLTNEITIEYDDFREDQTKWTLSPLFGGSGGTRPLPELKPGGGDVQINIRNLPLKADQQLGGGEEGVHFQGYVDLLRLPGEHAGRRPRLYAVPDTAGSPFNCMLAEAPIRP